METEVQPAGFTDVRAANLAVVLRHLRVNGPSSRASIAASTGLTKATVSSLAGDLIEQRLLRETGLSGNRIGRPSTVLALDGSAYAAIGVQVAADRLTALAVDFAGDRLLLWHRTLDGSQAPDSSRAIDGGRVPQGSHGIGGGQAPENGRAAKSSRPADAGPSAVIALVQRAAARVRKQGRHALGLTIAVPSTFLDQSGLGRTDLRALVAASLRQPDLTVTVENHAALAAAAEQRHGGHPGSANLTLVTGAAGLEAGFVVDGRPLRGARGLTGRFGRLNLGPAGTPALREQAGVGALVRRALPDADPASLTDLSPAVEQVAVLARAGDKPALAALRDTGGHLGRGLAVLADLADPEVIVLGDHYATLAEWLIPAAEADLGGARLVASKLGLHAAALGAAWSHLDRIDIGNL